MTPTLRAAAGSLLVVGLSGPEVTPLERAWLKLVRPAGIILFRRNILDQSQTRALLSESTRYCTEASLRCVDLEGGTVDRLRDAVVAMPSAQAVAQTENSNLIQLHGQLIARETRAFGFNITLAPVLDLGLPISSSVMGTRAASPTAVGVTEYARAFLTGLASQGVAGCGKHFPGLGGGTVDSHDQTPAITRTYADLWAEDLAPYRALIRQLPVIMVTHAAYPETRSKHLPATASQFWINTVLQQKLGFKGLIFSDDMEMGGILKFLPMEEAAIAAVRAGIHLLEICHSPELIFRGYESLIHEAERSAVFRKLLLDRATATRLLRIGTFKRPPGPALSAAQLVSLRNRILKFQEAIQGRQNRRSQ